MNLKTAYRENEAIKNLSYSYRYGFNGMEKDDEMYNQEGNSLDFGARMLDPRIGRWFSPDRYESLFAPVSTYSFVANMPIIATDVDGNILKIIGDENTVRTIAYQLGIIYGTVRGREILRRLIDDDTKTYTIRHSTDIADSYERNIRTTYYNAFASILLNDSPYKGDKAPYLNLMHELTHMADHNFQEEPTTRFLWDDHQYESSAMQSTNYLRSVLGFSNFRTIYDYTWPESNVVLKDYGNGFSNNREGEKNTNHSNSPITFEIKQSSDYTVDFNLSRGYLPRR